MALLDYIIHIDKYLALIINSLGIWTYVFLFAVIFAETGLVVTPFLPGDSLLFAVGAFAGAGYLNIWIVYGLMLMGAILGDTANYWIGHRLGPKVFSKENSRVFKKAYLEKTREFYDKHGGKTIILARFLPILRTFAPFVAGIGKMHYGTFIFYNVIGGFLWVTSLTFAGYLFGGLQFVKENFEYVIVGIVFLSILPMVWEFIQHKRGPKITEEELKHATASDIQETLRKDHLND